MRRTLFLAATLLFIFTSMAQDISVDQVPESVKNTLTSYLDILRSSSNLEACASSFVAIAGGSLVNEDGQSLRSSVQPYSLKKDYQNVRFYADPPTLTRVQKGKSNGTGFGPSAIKGVTYKIWIAKKDESGLPAPITLLVPEGHPTIKTPKIIRIGSL